MILTTTLLKKVVEKKLYPTSEHKCTPSRVGIGQGREACCVLELPRKNEMTRVRLAEDLDDYDVEI